MWQKVSQSGERNNNKCIIMLNKMQKQASHLLFLNSISKRGGGKMWIIGRWLNINKGVKKWEFAAFVRPCWTKTETMKASNKIKSFFDAVGINGSNFKNETLFMPFTAIITTRNGWDDINFYIGNIIFSSIRLSDRFGEHLRSVGNNDVDKPVALHFNAASYSISHRDVPDTTLPDTG